jgi:peptidoglycan/LPS O-acetylase OafA/YrhL
VCAAVGAGSLLGAVVLAAVWSGEQTAAVVAGWPLITLCSVGLILCSVDGRSTVARMLAVRPLRAVGKVSYGAYLWHFPVFVVIDETLGLDGAGPALLGIGVTAALTVVSYVAIERPFLRLKTRFEAPKRPAVVAEPASAADLLRA